jgi:hypothetical protein
VFKFMRKRWFVAALCFLAIPSFNLIHAQKDKRDPLTPDQQEKIAEAGVYPDERLSLYTKFADERIQRIAGLGKRTESGQGKRLDSEIQDFTAVVDELASNLDTYGDRKADIRKSLKDLNEDLPKWQEILSGLPKDPVTEVARRDATEALNDLLEDAKRYAAEQETYFKEHKDAKGQEREEPQ